MSFKELCSLLALLLLLGCISAGGLGLQNASANASHVIENLTPPLPSGNITGNASDLPPMPPDFAEAPIPGSQGGEGPPPLPS